MRVLVTGGNGAVGKATVARLVKNGFSVKVIGRSAGIEIPGAVYEVCDINDYPHLREAVRGFEAIVHLAAIPAPAGGSSDQVFYANAQGTFNVYKAAEEEGIQRVVQASSINALGVFYGRKPSPIHYLPVDEDHPCVATDVYSFSKQVIEDIGEYYWRRSGISGVAYRLPWVAPASHHAVNPGRQARVRAMVEKLERTQRGRTPPLVRACLGAVQCAAGGGHSGRPRRWRSASKPNGLKNWGMIISPWAAG